jgi:hypothetical protein
MVHLFKTTFALAFAGAILLFSFSALAQINPGVKLLETGLGRYVGPFPEFQNQEGFTVNPAAGIFIRENVAMGLSFGVASLGKHSGEGSGPDNVAFLSHEGSQNHFAVAPFVRKYIWLDEKLSFQAEIQAGYAQFHVRNMKEENTNFSYQRYDYLSRNQNLFVSFRPGFTYLLSPAVALTANYNALQAGVHKTKYKNNRETLIKETNLFTTHGDESDTRGKFFNLNATLSNFTIGASFFLGR